MNRVCIHIPSNKLIEFQEGNPELGTLRANAIIAGYLDADIDELYTDLTVSEAILAYELPADTTARLKRESDEVQRKQDIIDGLPDWQSVSDAIDTAFTDLKQRAVIKKGFRALYWLAKNTSE